MEPPTIWQVVAIVGPYVVLILNALVQLRLRFAASRDDAVRDLKALTLTVLNRIGDVVIAGLLIVVVRSDRPLTRLDVLVIAMGVCYFGCAALGFVVLRLIDRLERHAENMFVALIKLNDPAARQTVNAETRDGNG